MKRPRKFLGLFAILEQKDAKMKYNAEFNRWVTKGGLVYRYDSKQDKLLLCRLSKMNNGYLGIRVSKPKRKLITVHRLVYETFNGKIPQEMELDHRNTVRTDNRLDNLRCVTRKENMNNQLTIKHLYGRKNGKGKPTSEFGEKFKEHFGITQYQNMSLYKREYMWYSNHGHKCRWE